MSTIADIAQWVTDTQLKRDDMTDVTLGLARDVYTLICAKVPFDVLCVTSSELPVSTSTVTHSLAALSPALAGIISIRMTYGTASRVRRLRRSHARLFDMLNPTLTGDPALYARWGDSIEFNLLARTSGYTFRVRYWSRPTISADPGATVLLSPPEWDELMKWETLYRAYIALDQHEKAMSLVQPEMMPRQAGPDRMRMKGIGIIPRLWNDLLRTVSEREGADEEFSINPGHRNYTAAR